MNPLAPSRFNISVAGYPVMCQQEKAYFLSTEFWIDMTDNILLFTAK